MDDDAGCVDDGPQRRRERLFEPGARMHLDLPGDTVRLAQGVRSIRETSPERLRLLAKGGDYGLASVAGFERAYCVTLAKLLDGGNNTESGHL